MPIAAANWMMPSLQENRLRITIHELLAILPEHEPIVVYTPGFLDASSTQGLIRITLQRVFDPFSRDFGFFFSSPPGPPIIFAGSGA